MYLKERVGKIGAYSEGPLRQEDAGTQGLPPEAGIREDKETRAQQGAKMFLSQKV